ncbi:sarcinarray family MAST domain-containing protein [Methanosarcina sp. Mfa9]|uniref:sarcinarray family MAST domain-containing protein n=1 Tax=Methanosarcina sp. Mfa9 TaxID=3439063 RepID=UPI003F8780A2
MNMNSLLIGLLISLILVPSVVTASSPYGKMDVYYNGKLLQVEEVAKPVLNIGEPFDIGINLTVNQKCYVSTMLSEIGDNNFEIVTGSTSKMKEYETEVLDNNSTKMYEWTVKATDNWAGGSLPINLVYQINDFETGDILVKGKFTVAYPYISTEYYKGETPTTPESSSSESETSPESAPAFTTFGALMALALAVSRR